MFVILLAFCVVIGSSSAYALGPYQPRAVSFPFGGDAYLENLGYADLERVPPSGSAEGVCSFWFQIAAPPRVGETQTIMAVRQAGTDEELFNLAFSGSKLHPNELTVYWDSGAPKHHYRFAATNPPIRVDGGWKKLSIAWNGETVAGNYIGGENLENPFSLTWDISGNTIEPVAVPWYNTLWFIGAEAGIDGKSYNHFHGNLSELYCDLWHNIEDPIFPTPQQPRRRHSGFAYVRANGQFGPLELGPECSAIFGMRPVKPALCMRVENGRGVASFKENLNGDGAFIDGPLSHNRISLALTDPFGLWGPLGPPARPHSPELVGAEVSR